MLNKKSCYTIFSLCFFVRFTNSDAGAEAAQRQALALRCRDWEQGEEEEKEEDARGGPLLVVVASADRSTPLAGAATRAVAAKRAALPCLRNLASFVSNQGRHIDAEVVLVS